MRLKHLQEMVLVDFYVNNVCKESWFVNITIKSSLNDDIYGTFGPKLKHVTFRKEKNRNILIGFKI